MACSCKDNLYYGKVLFDYLNLNANSTRDSSPRGSPTRVFVGVLFLPIPCNTASRNTPGNQNLRECIATQTVAAVDGAHIESHYIFF